MNEVDWLKSLNSPTPAVPTIDVSRDVMRELSHGLRPAADRTALWVWSIAAAFGLTASTAAGLFAFSLWQAANDPAQSFASTWNTVMQ